MVCFERVFISMVCQEGGTQAVAGGQIGVLGFEVQGS